MAFLSANAQQKKIWNESPEEKKERLAWWTNDRFGLFIHWWPYSLAARHEWVKKREQMEDMVVPCTSVMPQSVISVVMVLLVVTIQSP